MKIFDRYNPDSSQERRRYEERLAKAKRSLREDYDAAGNRALACYLACPGIALALGIWWDYFPKILQGVLPGVWGISVVVMLLAMVRMDKRGNDEEMDLYIFGMEDGRFLLVNPIYEELGSIAPGEVKEIRILSAMRPTTRQRYVDRHYGEQTHYEYYVGGTMETGEIDAYPMAVLCAGEEIDWSWIDDPIFRRQLNTILTFVPLGDNAEAFVHLLRESRCPVVAVPDVYERYREQLDALFVCSGMDMKRFGFMKENPEQAKMTKIIG